MRVVTGPARTKRKSVRRRPGASTHSAETSQGRAAALLRRVGERVRRARGELGLTARELAGRAGLSLRFVTELEGGRANIAIGRLQGVADALGLSLAELVADPVAAPRARGVALVGLRGAGKSTLGARLAAALSVPFVELDQRIEEAAGLSLAELFAIHGEAYYRRLELEALQALIAAERPFVVALGGGVVHDAEAWELARRHCTTVWLRARPEDHMDRVLAQGDRRPVADRPDAMAELRRLLAAREPLYGQAALQVDTSALGAEALPALVRAVQAQGWAPPAPARRAR